MSDTGPDGHTAKRVKIEDGLSTSTSPKPRMSVQTAVTDPQAATLDNSPAKPSEEGSGISIPSSTNKTITSDQPKVIEIDPRGDVNLLVKWSGGRLHTVYVVCSRTLARVSLDWEYILFPSNPKANVLCARTIELLWPESEIFQVVLQVLHSNTSRVPDSLSNAQLEEFIQLGRKYSIMPVLVIWGIKWFNRHPEGPESTASLVRRMWITNELGLTDLFRSSLSAVALQLQTDSDGQLILPLSSGGLSIRLQHDQLHEKYCLEVLERLRFRAIREQLDSLKVVVDSLVSPATSGSTLGLGCQTCTYKWIGCMIRHLSAPSPSTVDPRTSTSPLWPIPQLEAYPWSLDDLRKHLLTVQHDLDSLERCQGDTRKPSNRGRGSGARGNGRGSTGNRAGARCGRGPCEPPRLLLTYPKQSFESGLWHLKTRFERNKQS